MKDILIVTTDTGLAKKLNETLAQYEVKGHHAASFYDALCLNGPNEKIGHILVGPTDINLGNGNILPSNPVHVARYLIATNTYAHLRDGPALFSGNVTGIVPDESQISIWKKNGYSATTLEKLAKYIPKIL